MTKDQAKAKIFELYDEILEMIKDNDGYTNDRWEAQKTAYYECIDIIEEIDKL